MDFIDSLDFIDPPFRRSIKCIHVISFGFYRPNVIIIIAGDDANIDLYSYDIHSETYYGLLQSRGLLTLITLPTRGTVNGGTLRNHI